MQRPDRSNIAIVVLVIAGILLAIGVTTPLAHPILRSLDEVLNPATARTVTFGADGWLFQKNHARYDCKQLDAPERLADDLAAYVQTLPAGQRRFVLLHPSKDYVHADRIAAALAEARSPFSRAILSGDVDIHRCAANRYDRDMDALARRLGDTYFDLRQALSSRRNETAEALYYKDDSHWTPATSVFVGSLVLERLHPGLWQSRDVETRPGMQRVADQAKELGRDRTFTVTRYVTRRRGVVATVHRVVPRPASRQPLRVYQNVATDPSMSLYPGRTVIVYDSFFIPNLDALTPYFADVSWVFWEDAFTPDMQALIVAADTLVMAGVYRSMSGYARRLSALARGDRN
ncbi:MAG: alginate O-acetyltransferase AlgX-related protein [Hyphomicrobiaceae bacterium]